MQKQTWTELPVATAIDAAALAWLITPACSCTALLITPSPILTALWPATLMVLCVATIAPATVVDDSDSTEPAFTFMLCNTNTRMNEQLRKKRADTSTNSHNAPRLLQRCT